MNQTNTNNRDRVPATTEHTGKQINGFRVVTASDMRTARHAAVFAAATGSTGSEEYHFEVAGPAIMPEDRKIERWAIVERDPRPENQR